jgi:hypothetical protein
MFGAMDLGIADDGQRACCEQAAQIAISLFADTAELVPTPSSMQGCRVVQRQCVGRSALMRINIWIILGTLLALLAITRYMQHQGDTQRCMEMS